MEVNKNNPLMPASNLHSLEDEELIEGLFAIDGDKPHKRHSFIFLPLNTLLERE